MNVCAKFYGNPSSKCAIYAIYHLKGETFYLLVALEEAPGNDQS